MRTEKELRSDLWEKFSACDGHGVVGEILFLILDEIKKIKKQGE